MQIIQIDGDTIVPTPHPEFEYTLTTEQVALGYGVTQVNIRQHKRRQSEELHEGKHYVTVTNSNGGEEITLWTKRGVIRLGFFIRSKRAKQFRDMAEDLVITQLAHAHAYNFGELERLAGLTARAIEVQVGEVKAELRAEIDERFDRLPIQGEEIEAVHSRAVQLGELMGGTARHRARAWRIFKDRFRLASYRDLPKGRLAEALAFLDAQLEAYAPPAGLTFGVRE